MTKTLKKPHSGARKLFVDRFFKQFNEVREEIHKDDTDLSKLDIFAPFPKDGLLPGRRRWSDLTENEKLVMNLAYAIAEIERSAKTLALIPSLFNSHSTYLEKKRFSRVQQHKRNIGWYLNEVYSFSNRTEYFLKLMKKALIKSRFSKTSTEVATLNSLRSVCIESLRGINEVRGRHVHVRSYFDKALSKIELWEEMAKYISHGTERNFHESLTWKLLRSDRKSWKERTEKNAAQLEELLDYLYHSLDTAKIINKLLEKYEK
ncbi:MAG: hypothetical protein COV91_00415 [Candidatus Taylorbacteria bacterium CG11_big_fil_rev_8_21_14_0_20_46_11]|uniref:Cthe-2314-like HEPN domain-containing protein n=1 Tax=Candidatus Taylorbacteria bacterium CG11_big_fil_rev_8_21_14_0_20_46_11 TaxID=1975025 RepID=A0A2H0KCZ6_9BACT|nr:MAG: hypothetical protein COV91_00415 [Candidatus Taylorbacteria bacterium CG11_big_fil_rev_8_21_14_0_20_46_11]